MAIVPFVFSKLAPYRLASMLGQMAKEKLQFLLLPKTLFQLYGLHRPMTLAKITILAVLQANILKLNLRGIAKAFNL